MLFVQIGKTICFQPLTKEIHPTAEDDETTAHDIQEYEKTHHVEHDDHPKVEGEMFGEKDAWYKIMRYRIRTKLWFMFPVFAALDLIITVVYIYGEVVDQVNIFTAVSMNLTMFASCFMILQYIKCFVYEKFRHNYPLL